MKYESQNASDKENDCLTNSSLPRVIAVAIWMSNIDSLVKLKEMVVSEVEVTHRNKAVQELCFVYAVAV